MGLHQFILVYFVLLSIPITKSTVWLSSLSVDAYVNILSTSVWKLYNFFGNSFENLYIIQFTHLEYTIQGFLSLLSRTNITISFQSILIPKSNSISIGSHYLFPPPDQHPWQSFLYFLSMDLPTWDISYKWDHTTCSLL